MTESTEPQSSIKNFDKYFKWEKIKTAEPKEKIIKPPNKQWKMTTMQEGLVPPLPRELVYAPELQRYNEKQKEKITRKMFNNPLLPIGMAATVFCLIGSFLLN